jgi:hypothetical protein
LSWPSKTAELSLGLDRQGRLSSIHGLVAASAVSTAAKTATATASWAASSTSSSTTAAGATTSVSATIRSTISGTFRASLTGAGSGYRGVAVEIGFVVSKVGATFDGQRGSMSGFTAAALSSTIFRWKFAAAHFRALLFEDSFARQTNAVALDGQHFYQHLVAFFQFIANVLDAVLRNFADMQQTVGAGDDLDERAEIGQPRHSTEVGLAYLGRGGQVADDLQGLGCRSLVV